MPVSLCPQPNLPDDLLDAIAKLPPRMTRKRAAKELEQHLGIVTSHRTLERWPLPVQFVCGKALIPTASLFEVGHSKLVEAPIILGGQRNPTNKERAPAEAQT